MASKLSPLLRSFGRPSLRQAASLRVSYAAYSTDAPAPPLLVKIKDDLKAAMRAKDTNRLSVLRTVLSATLNASKTDKPIRTDVQLVNLLQATARKSADSAAEARAAGREDLAEKEEAQQRILEEYASSSGVRELGEADLLKIVESAKAEFVAQGVQGKGLSGQVMKKLFAPGGPLDGASYEKGQVVRLIQQSCSAE